MRIWSQAKEMAALTPDARNRYVDFLRALSILFVVIGHWLIATAYVVDGEMIPGHLLEAKPEFHWLTWLFQVMPIFFMVGGYSNAVSLESAKRKGTDYAGWLAGRLNRLVAPLLTVLFAWALISVVLLLFGVSIDTVQFVSRSCLIPTWFLAIYIMVVILAPAVYRLWQRFGFLSFWAFTAMAALTDVAFFAADLQWLGWTNYFWVWLAVHQLGFAWRDGRTGGPMALLGIAAIAFVAMYFLIFKGPYPLAMVSSPGEGVSNTLPPKITLLVLGVVQFGLLLSLEKPMRAALSGLRLWSGTVLINSMIMTVYLWHMSVLAAVVAILYYTGGFGLGVEPGTTDWWLLRPVWIGGLLVLLLPFSLLLSPFERRGRSPDAPVSGAARQIAGAAILCLGLAVIAMYGYGGGPSPWLTAVAFALVVIGAWLGGLLPRTN
jgi:peptidoglycan/LPS O-acetylase OafA/YrhL